MTWRNKNNEFIYPVITSTARDRIEQITTKNFNQNAYLGKIDRENKFWLHRGRKIYRTVNWVYRHYRYFDHKESLDNKRPYYSEQIRKQAFNKEKRKERKIVYTTSGYFKTLMPEEKKAVALIIKGNRLTIRAVPDTRFFVPEKIYNERRRNFLKNATFVAKYNVRLILGFDFEFDFEFMNLD